MQTFESGGELNADTNRQMRDLFLAFACGAAVAALPPLVGLYLLIIS